MKDYLRQTNGTLCTGAREAWELAKCKDMLCHNNGAERPFAVLRQYKRIYPSMSIDNLSKLSNSIVNGTHRSAMRGLAGGIALTADPRLKKCIGTLCSVRRVKVPPPLPSSPHPPTPQYAIFQSLTHTLPFTKGGKDHRVHAGCNEGRQKKRAG